MPLMHLLIQPWIWGQPGGQQPGPRGVQGCPCKACSLLCGTWRPHFPWLGRSQALGKVSPKSQLSDSHSCMNSEHASQPSACFSKSASPNVRRGQEESVSLPRGENSCQAVPRGAASLWWHNGRTQPVQLSLFPVQGGSVSTAAAGSPVLSLAASLEKGWQKREEKSEMQASMLKGLAQHSAPLLHGCGWAGSWGPSANPIPWDPHTT